MSDLKVAGIVLVMYAIAWVIVYVGTRPSGVGNERKGEGNENEK